jgi:hypothetical protein
MSAPGNGCNVQRFKLLICLTMESHIKVTDLLSVKMMGDWKSDAYKKYIVCSLTDKFMVAEKIRDFILK